METLILVGVGIVAVCLIFSIIFAIKGMSTKGLEKTLTNLGGAAARAQNNIINNNEDILKETANKTANINKDAVKTMAHAIKEGFTEDVIYCKHCGALIDSDSKFCKSCGKEQ